MCFVYNSPSWEQKTKHAGSDSPSKAVLPAPAALVLETSDGFLRLHFLAMEFDINCLSSILNPCVPCPWDSCHQPF